MQSRLSSYLSFRGKAKEAMEFYKTVFGGKLELTTFKDSGMPHDPAEADNVMHSMLTADNGIIFMGSDVPSTMELTPGANISLTLNGDNSEELTKYFNELSVGGTVEQPLTKSPWGDMFGMFTDKFGIHWMVNISEKKA